MTVTLYAERSLAGDLNPARAVLNPITGGDLKALVDARPAASWLVTLSGRPRSRQEEKWYRALVGVVAEGIGMEPNTLHFHLKVETGKILEMVRSPTLGFQLVTKSSRDMDHEEFHAFVTMATEILFLKYLPEVKRKDVYKEVERRVQPTGGRGQEARSSHGQFDDS